MHAAAVCAGGVWRVRSSRGGSEGCRADRLTRGLRRPVEPTKGGGQETTVNGICMRCAVKLDNNSFYSENICPSRPKSSLLFQKDAFSNASSGF